jgi:hypothetical protein
MRTILMFFQVIAHHAHHDYAERISVQAYPTLHAIDDQSSFRYLADFAKRSKNPRCYKWCGSVSHWTRERRCHESNRYSARSDCILPSRILPDRCCARFVNFPGKFNGWEDAEGSSYWLGYGPLSTVSTLANLVNF